MCCPCTFGVLVGHLIWMTFGMRSLFDSSRVRKAASAGSVGYSAPGSLRVRLSISDCYVSIEDDQHAACRATGCEKPLCRFFKQMTPASHMMRYVNKAMTQPQQEDESNARAFNDDSGSNTHCLDTTCSSLRTGLRLPHRRSALPHSDAGRPRR